LKALLPHGEVYGVNVVEDVIGCELGALSGVEVFCAVLGLDQRVELNTALRKPGCIRVVHAKGRALYPEMEDGDGFAS
jgi:hypothetical protein